MNRMKAKKPKKTANERELGRRARKLMSDAHGCSIVVWGGGDTTPRFVRVGPLIIRSINGDISVHTPSGSQPITIYEEDKFGFPIKPLLPGAVKAALEEIKQHMILDDLADA
jgi:hypothetical protein